MRRGLPALASLVVACAPAPGDPGTRDAGGRSLRDAGVVDAAATPMPDAAARDGATPDAAAPVDGGAVPGRDRELLREGFDAMTVGAPPAGRWVTTGGVAVQEVPFAADRSVELHKPAGAALASLSTDFEDPLTGRIVIESDVMAREIEGFAAIPYVYDEAGRAAASVAFQDGNVVAWVGETLVTVQPFRAGVWYRVRIVVDTDAGAFDLFVDGVRKLQGVALRTAAGSIARIRYYLDGAGDHTLLVDGVRVYREADYIGAPPGPVFDARSYGAMGDGATDDTAALQRAIDAAAGTGGSVLLDHGTYLSGTLTLRSHMTFFIGASATLLGSASVADYPAQSPDTGNTQLHNCRRALLYAPEATDLHIDGGGTIDGQGDAFAGSEAERPMLVWLVRSEDVSVRNLYLKKGAVWSLVSMESDHVLIRNINLQSNWITHDGIDIVDGRDVTVEDCAVRSGDDAMCLKSGVRRGLEDVVIRNCVFSGDNGGSNGVKFGTASYGAFRNVLVEEVYIKDIQHAAMAVESRQGADVSGISFRRVGFANVGSAFFVYLAQQNETHPEGDVPRLGTMDGVSFVDVAGWTASFARSPHQAALITGHVYEGATYYVTGLEFRNVAVTFTGGRDSVPADPPEALPNQYPESNMFGDLPAWGYFLRHVSGVTFDSCEATVARPDARPELETRDVTGMVGTP